MPNITDQYQEYATHFKHLRIISGVIRGEILIEAVTPEGRILTAFRPKTKVKSQLNDWLPASTKAVLDAI